IRDFHVTGVQTCALPIYSKIITRVPQTDEAGNTYMKRVETTPGRMLIGETLPKSHKVPYDIVNRLLTKKEIGDVIDTVYRHCGQIGRASCRERFERAAAA